MTQASSASATMSRVSTIFGSVYESCSPGQAASGTAAAKTAAKMKTTHDGRGLSETDNYRLRDGGRIGPNDRGRRHDQFKIGRHPILTDSGAGRSVQ